MRVAFPLVQTVDRLINQLQQNIKQSLESAINALFNLGTYESATAGSAVTPGASNAFVNVASMTLEPGDWDVSGTISFGPGSLTGNTYFSAAVSSVSQNYNGSGADGFTQGGALTTTADTYAPVSPRRFLLTNRTTVYLIARLDYVSAGTSTWKADSFLRARLASVT